MANCIEHFAINSLTKIVFLSRPQKIYGVKMNSHRIVLFIIIFVCNFNCPAFANNSSENLNPAEKYVIEKVKKGEAADFTHALEKNRILNANFLKQLLTGTFLGLDVTEKGIHIKGARIKEKFAIPKEKISFPVSLIKCIFYKDIIFFQTNFFGEANFYSNQIRGKTNFSYVKFSERANFNYTKFSGEASFDRTKFSGDAFFNDAEFSEAASFTFTEFSGKAHFRFTKFSKKAHFGSAEFSGKVNFHRADLSNADLSDTDLSKTDLIGADLSEANLSEANLKDCLLWNVRGFPLNYEPKAGSPPYIPSIANLPNLSKLTFKESPHGLLDLREGFKRLGYREQERMITYAIKYTQRRKLWNNSKKNRKDTESSEKEKNSQKSISIWSKFEGLFYLIFFEITCQYGMKPGRPLIILICLIPFFSFFYIFALKTRRRKTGLWLFLLKERVLKATKEERSFKLTANFPPRVIPTGMINKVKLRILRSYRMIRIALYFSLLSATTIGWREFNVGNWISRLQRREYTLKATGWVRTVSGLQSLISVYLLALWVLTFFGRPFEAI